MNSFLKKTLIISLVYLLFIGGLLYFALLPTYNNFQKNKKLSLEKQSLVDSNESKINSLKKVEKNDAEFGKLFDNVSKLWPDSLEVSDFIVQMEGLAKDTDIIIDSFSVDEQKPAPEAKATTKTSEGDDSSATKNTKDSNSGTKFTITFKTSYSTFLDVITRMETLSRLNNLSSVRLNSSDEGLNVSLTGTIYYGK